MPPATYDKPLAFSVSLPVTDPQVLQAASPIVLALAECDEELRAEALELFKQLHGGELDEEQRVATTALLVEILFPNGDGREMPDIEEEEAGILAPAAKEILARMDHEETFFAQRLHEIMGAKGVTQAELAQKMGIGQPAISMMLNRSCRPQRKTVQRFAEALGVSPDDLWPKYRP